MFPTHPLRREWQLHPWQRRLRFRELLRWLTHEYLPDVRYQGPLAEWLHRVRDLYRCARRLFFTPMLKP